MAEFPADIMKDAEEAFAGFMGWVNGGNTTASLSEHAVAGLKHSFASAILAERERCNAILLIASVVESGDVRDVLDGVSEALMGGGAA